MPSLLSATSEASGKIALLVALGVLLETRGVMNEDVRSGFSKVVCIALLPLLFFIATVAPLRFDRVPGLTPLVLSCTRLLYGLRVIYAVNP